MAKTPAKSAEKAPAKSKTEPKPAKDTKAAKAAPKAAAASKGKSEKPAVPAAKKVNAALAKPLKPSDNLAAIVGKSPLPRTEVVSKVWDYIRKNNLQNPQNKREILADAKLKSVFGKDKVTMFEMNKLFSAHLT